VTSGPSRSDDKSIGAKFGNLDILINNSGIIRDRTIKKLTLEDFESVLRVI
jgi:NAD(P)-dependent dehydrogenase (short-subunit alcohol dehydrogenase family)